MKQNFRTVFIATVLLIVFFTGSVFALRNVEASRGREATLEDVLYLPSSKTIKRLSLGYSGLLADIYWTRAVQYFGSKHIRHSQRYDLLYPLLDIATDLDPHMIVAYENGSVFLSQQPPEGAGQPDKAVKLVEKGIRENPDHWRLYFALGFLHYIDRHDYKAAQKAFQTGSQIPGAQPWMKVMAARMAERSKDIHTAAALWQELLQQTTNKEMQKTARLHLASIQADHDINGLERLVKLYEQRIGSAPKSWEDMQRAGLLHGTPLAPYGEPYVLKNGSVEVQDASKYRYLGEWRYNEEEPF